MRALARHPTPFGYINNFLVCTGLRGDVSEL